MTGMTSSVQEKPLVMAEAPGRRFSQKTKMAERKTALANCGIEVVSTERMETRRSTQPPSRMPASTPRPPAP